MAGKRITIKWLRKRKIDEKYIKGILLALAVGMGGLGGQKMYDYINKSEFPATGIVRIVEDGDTFELQNGKRVRMVGINAPDRGEKGYEEARGLLSSLILNKRVWLEYDRYQDDQHQRTLAWIWIACEGNPKFLDKNYMHLSKNQSRAGLTENPVGCKKGKLVQEELVRDGKARVETYKDRGELKYEERIKDL